MGRLTSDERRRIFLAQRQSAGEVLAPLRAAPVAREHGAPRPQRRLLAAAMIVMLLSGVWVASHPHSREKIRRRRQATTGSPHHTIPSSRDLLRRRDAVRGASRGTSYR